MKNRQFLVLFIFILSLFVPSVVSATCATAQNATLARLDITDGSGRNYLIDVNEQAFAAARGNVAGLEFRSNPDRWLVNDKLAPLPFQHVYHITFMGEGAFGNLQNVGDIWFATLDGYDDVYFWYMLPVTVTGIETVGGVQQYAVLWSDHPNCSPAGGYGSTARSTVDALLKPRP